MKFTVPTDKLDILGMPSMIIMNANALPLFTIFREYVAYKSICKGVLDTTLPSNYVVINFLNCIDCYELYLKFIYFWKNEV